MSGLSQSALQRFIPHRNRVLILTGGGSRGAGQVGMLKAITDSGITFDGIIGCSVGSLNAAVYANDPTDSSIGELSRIWHALHNNELFPVRLRTIIGGLLNRPHLFPDGPLRALIARELPIRDLSDSKVPLGVVTTELRTGKSVLWREGDALELLTASASLPGFFPPVLLDNKLHIDGGIGSAAPVNAAVSEFGAKEVWVLDVLSEPSFTKRLTARSMIDAAFVHTLRRNADSEISNAKRTTIRHLLLPSDLRQIESTDFKHTGELIDGGYRAGLELIRNL